MHASCLSVCLNLAFAFFRWDGIEGDHIEWTCWSVRFKIGHFEVLDLLDLKHREFISEGSVTFAIGNLSLHRKVLFCSSYDKDKIQICSWAVKNFESIDS